MSATKKKMRLSLRKHFKPYGSLREIADDFDLTIPELKRLIRRLEASDTLKLGSLSASDQEEKPGEAVFELFHQFQRCLVCGHKMDLPEKREIGWGEFKECRLCHFSAHELAKFETLKESANKDLAKLREQASLAQRVLQAREIHKDALRKRQALK